MSKKIQGCIVAVLLFAAGSVLPFGLSGCNAAFSGGCGASVDPALTVYVTDAVTGQPAAANATVKAIDGSFTETLPVGVFDIDPSGNEIPLAFSGPTERAGTYTVRVERAGYAATEKKGIRVTKGNCGVKTETVTIALTPLTPLPAQ